MDYPKITKKISAVLFYVGICLEFIVSFSGFAYGGYHEPVIIVSGMVCFSLSILFGLDIYKIRKELLIYMIVAGYGLACYYFQHSALILRIGLILIAGRERKARDVIRLFFIGTVVVMAVTGVLSALGIYGELRITDLFRHVPETRYCFGFYHPNGFAMFLVRVVIMGIYLYGERMAPRYYAICLAITGILLVLVNSKMAYAAVAVVVVGHIVVRHKSGRLIKLLYVGGLVAMASEILAIIIYCCNYRYIDSVISNENNVWYYINALTSGRLFNAARVWQEAKPTLMGVSELTNGTEIGFFNAMYGQGIVFIVLYLVVQFYLYHRSYKKREYYSMLQVLGFAIYCLAEAFIPYANKNMVWMLMVGMSLNKSNTQESK